jgi:hypothetical protein
MANNEGPEIDWSDLDELQPNDSTVDVLREAEQQGTGGPQNSTDGNHNEPPRQSEGEKPHCREEGPSSAASGWPRAAS